MGEAFVLVAHRAHLVLVPQVVEGRYLDQ